MDWAILLLSFHIDELCARAIWLWFKVYLGKLISLSLAHEHSAISANTATQLLAGRFG